MRLVYLLFLLICSNFLVAQGFSQKMKLVASDRNTTDYFGQSIASSNNTAIIGAHQEDEDAQGLNTKSGAGSAYILELSATGFWNESQKIVASDRGANDFFGFAADISGNYAVVGAYREDHDVNGTNSVTDAGAAYIFEKDSNGVWNEVQKVVASDRQSQDYFGFSVAISGNYIAVGAYDEDHNLLGQASRATAGSAYIFERNSNGLWTQVQKIIASDRDIGDRFAYSLAMSGNTLVCSAPFEDHDAMGNNFLSTSGSIYVFERNTSGIWVQDLKMAASDRKTGDQFGTSVDILGNVIAAGAYRNSWDTSGLNLKNEAGAAYIIKRNTQGNWFENQKVVASDRTSGDWFGSALSISNDFLIVGAIEEDHDTSGLNFLSLAGSAYVFEKKSNGRFDEMHKIVPNDRDGGDRFGSALTISDSYALITASTEDEDTLGLNTLLSAGSAYAFKTCLSYSYVSETACLSYLSPSGNYVWTSSGQYTDTLLNANNCDSLITIDLVISQSSSNVSVKACGSYTVPSGHETYTTYGTYAVYDTVPNAFNCDSLLNIQLTLDSNTTSSLIISECDSYTLPSGKQTFSKAGNYSLVDTIDNSNGCDSVITINLTIDSLDITVSISGNDLVANLPAADYQWLDCENDFSIISGETNKAFTPNKSGSFAVEIVQNSCIDTSECTPFIINEIGELTFNKFVIYPNPTQGIIHIETGHLNEFSAKILNTHGHVIYQEEKLFGPTLSIELNSKPGLYYLEIESNALKKQFKLLIY